MNLNRREKNSSHYDSTWKRPKTREWQSVTQKSPEFVIVHKNQAPAILTGIKQTSNQSNPLSIFELIKKLITYPTDELAKFIGWLFAPN